MRLIEPSFELTTPFGDLTPELGIKMLRFIEQQARISHRSEDSQTDDSWQRFIKAVVLEHGDWSVAEHASVTAVVRTDRGITHEIVRHRIGSYTQESTRFVNYKNRKLDLEFIRPAELLSLRQIWEWEQGIKNAEEAYLGMLEEGAKPQEARAVLPNSLAATIAVTMNLRSWRQFFLMRTSRETHTDFRRWSIPMLQEFQKMIPLLYDDINPNDRQIDNLRKPR